MSAPAHHGGAVPVAVAVHLRTVLTGPSRPASVVVSGRLATYVRVEPDDDHAPATPHAQVLAVVAQDAVAPAGALVLPAGLRPDLLLPVGLRLEVGDGVVRSKDCAARSAGGTSAGRLVLRPSRWFVAPHVIPGAVSLDAVRLLADRLAALPTPPDDVVVARAVAVHAAGALADRRRDDAVRLLGSRLGLGPGTTPSGDDVAAGVLLAARALQDGGPDALELDAVAAAVSELATDRTTTVSAALLAEAAAGRCAAPVARALAALAPATRHARRAGAGHRPAPAPRAASTNVDDALDGLLALGHHSGADLATGLLAVLATACGAPPVPRPLSANGPYPAPRRNLQHSEDASDTRRGA